MGHWLIVLSNRNSLEWVLTEGRMAFRKNVPSQTIHLSDRFVLYTTRGAYGSTTKDESQLIAYGRITGDVVEEPLLVAGRTYSALCDLAIDKVLPMRNGALFRPLITSLAFISQKEFWWSYVHKTLVPVSLEDFHLMQHAIDSMAVSADDNGAVL